MLKIYYIFVLCYIALEEAHFFDWHVDGLFGGLLLEYVEANHPVFRMLLSWA